MKVSRAIAFILVLLAVLMTATGGVLDMAGERRRCGCGCPRCAAGRCGAAWGASCPCKGGQGLFVSKQHVWNDGLFLMLLAIVILLAF